MDAPTLTAIALVITAIGSTISALATFYNIAVSKQNAAHLQKVEAATNGMKTELVNEVRQASFAAGEKSEKEKR
jgi:hypothetical protein